MKDVDRSNETERSPEREEKPSSRLQEEVFGLPSNLPGAKESERDNGKGKEFIEFGPLYPEQPRIKEKPGSENLELEKPKQEKSNPDGERQKQDKESQNKEIQKPEPPKNPEKEKSQEPGGDKAKPAEHEPTIRISIDNSGDKVVIKSWTSGPQKGEREETFKDGSKVRYKPDGKGGMFVDQTRKDGTTVKSHTYPDGKGNVIVESVDSKYPEGSYTAIHHKDGSLTVDYNDGRHLERRKDADGTVHSKMTGPKARDNYTATESKEGGMQVNYADGSGFTYKEGKWDVHGKYGGMGILDKILPMASDGRHSTFWELNAAFWMKMSAAVYDVRRMNGMRVYD